MMVGEVVQMSPPSIFRITCSIHCLLKRPWAELTPPESDSTNDKLAVRSKAWRDFSPTGFVEGEDVCDGNVPWFVLMNE